MGKRLLIGNGEGERKKPGGIAGLGRAEG